MHFKPVNVSVVCEGETEIEIIKVLNKKYFASKAIFLKPILIGGDVRVDRLVNHIKKAPSPVVTTFVDYYGFKIRRGATVQEIKELLKSKLNEPHFIPYLQIHETEALCFANKEVLCAKMNADDKQKREIEAIISEFHDCPERINNAPQTAPSKRLEKIFANYKKISDGKRIIEAMPICDLISKCPNFAQWLVDIETEVDKIRSS